MKKCPKCNLEYSDRTLEFCLEDGARLISPILTKTSEETVVLQNVETPTFNPIPSDSNLEAAKTTKVQELKDKTVEQGYKVLEVAPIVFSLFHNYWQWLYADNQRFYSIIEFFLSGSFIVWFVLLIIGLVISLAALKFGKNKGFAITSLIVLAINFLLFIVPRR